MKKVNSFYCVILLPKYHYEQYMRLRASMHCIVLQLTYKWYIAWWYIMQIYLCRECLEGVEAIWIAVLGVEHAVSPLPFHQPFRGCHMENRQECAACNWRKIIAVGFLASRSVQPYVRCCVQRKRCVVAQHARLYCIWPRLSELRPHYRRGR